MSVWVISHLLYKTYFIITYEFFTKVPLFGDGCLFSIYISRNIFIPCHIFFIAFATIINYNYIIYMYEYTKPTFVYMQ